MKIAAVLENKIDTGGGFSMSVDLLLTIQDAAKKSKSDFIIINFHKENSNYLKTLNLEHITISDYFFDKIFAFINTSLLGMYLNSKFKLKTFFEKKLLQNKIDFIFFVTPSARPFYLQELNYAITVFDVCHIDYPEFSEVNSFNIFHLREKILKMCVGPATYVITESEKLKQKISSIYNKDINRIISIPNRPSPFLKYSKIDKKFSIFSNLPKRFFFYPAQFWEHKNHIKILHSLYKLKKKGYEFHVVFCGKDKGNLKKIKNVIKKFFLDQNIIIFDFLSHEQVSYLYQNAEALIMPTYFGPTNYPPLEAWANNLPVIYSNHLEEHTKNAALYCDPESEDSISKCILKIRFEKKLKNKLIQNGNTMLKMVEKKRQKSLELLVKKIIEFRNRRDAWENL